MTTFTDFQINTGEMYTELTYQEENFSKDFIHEFELNLESIYSNIINNGDAIDFILLPANEPYSLEKRNEYTQYVANWRSNSRPFTWFTIRSIPNSRDSALIEFVQSVIINRNENDKYFDFFFAARLRLTDILHLRKFLSFQLNNSFSNNIEEYTNFIQDLMVRYQNVLNDEGQNTVIKNFLSEVNDKLSDNKIDTLKDSNTNYKNPEDTKLSVQVLIIHYLLESIQERLDISLAEKARFIKLLTGKSIDNIKKLVSSPLAGKNKELRTRELTEVMQIFSKLNLDQVVQRIKKDLP